MIVHQMNCNWIHLRLLLPFPPLPLFSLACHSLSLSLSLSLFLFLFFFFLPCMLTFLLVHDLLLSWKGRFEGERVNERRKRGNREPKKEGRKGNRRRGKSMNEWIEFIKWVYISVECFCPTGNSFFSSSLSSFQLKWIEVNIQESLLSLSLNDSPFLSLCLPIFSLYSISRGLLESSTVLVLLLAHDSSRRERHSIVATTTTKRTRLLSQNLASFVQHFVPLISFSFLLPLETFRPDHLNLSLSFCSLFPSPLIHFQEVISHDFVAIGSFYTVTFLSLLSLPSHKSFCYRSLILPFFLSFTSLVFLALSSVNSLLMLVYFMNKNEQEKDWKRKRERERKE